jgi:hypothetical protein
MPSRSRKPESESEAENPSSTITTGELLAFLLGALFVFFLGFGTVASTLQSVAWRLRIQRDFREGQCRVVRAKVVEDAEDGPYALDIEHRVEVDGKVYGPTTWTEEERPHANSRAEAEALLTRYKVGELYPCWYDPANPDHNSVLLHGGLHPWQPLRYLWRSVVFSIPGLLLCLWPLHRLRARRQKPARKAAPRSAGERLR